MGGDDVFHHRFLLVDLNRVDGGVLGIVIVFVYRLVKCATQAFHTVLQNIGEAKQHRQVLAALVYLRHQIVHIDGLFRIGTRFYRHVALGIDAEIAVAPMVDAVDAGRVFNTPTHAISSYCRFHGAHGNVKTPLCAACALLMWRILRKVQG